MRRVSLVTLLVVFMLLSSFSRSASATSSNTIAISTVSAQFFTNPTDSGAFTATPADTVIFSQNFPVINFNPPSGAIPCSNATGVGVTTRPFTDLFPQPDGSCITIAAQGGGQQAGLGNLFSFDAVFKGSLTVPTAGQVTLSFFSDDGWILSIGKNTGGTQPTYVSGPMISPPPFGPFTNYSVVGSYNTGSSPTPNILVVDFPAAGIYPFELDYSECCAGELALTLTANGQPIPSALYDFKQNRNADGSPTSWGPDILYDMGNDTSGNANCWTMAKGGCGITALADVLASYGLPSLPNGTSVEPGDLNHYLTTVVNNKAAHSGCLMLWDNVGTIVNYTVHTYFPASTSLATRIDAVDKALNNNNLAIAGISGETGDLHYVVFYAKAPPAADGSPDYFIADPYRHLPLPGDYSGKTLSQAYGSNKTINKIAWRFQVIVVENKAPQVGRSWVVVAHSPVEMLMTDPNGVQTGFIPTTGAYVLNIPDSSYGVQEGLGDDDGVGHPLPSALYFGQSHMEDGTYKLQVIGTGSGPYTLDFAIANGPMDTSLQTIAGTAAPGKTDTYIISTLAGQPVSIHQQSSIYIPYVER